LNKNVKVYVGAVQALLDSETSHGFTATLAHYARTLSAKHTANMAQGVKAILNATASSSITVTTLINFRARLTPATEYHLGAVSGFICAWHDLGYPGIDDDVVDLLESWTLRGNDKGDAIKRLDPAQGPLTDNELMAFNESATSAFEKDQISITDLSIALLTSNTGRRPIQVTHTKICDLDGTRKNKKGDPMYVINIPRAKQQGEGFRESFTAFAMSHELWAVLNAQRKICIASVEKRLGYELQEADRSKLPLFPDLDAFYHVNSLAELRQLLQTDYFHLKSETITDILQKVVSKSECHSERTGEILELTARRFRYTIGARAAREGCGKMIIAELLDHADTQNVDVYTANTPEFAAKLDEKLGFLMAPYAMQSEATICPAGSGTMARVRAHVGHMDIVGPTRRFLATRARISSPGLMVHMKRYIRTFSMIGSGYSHLRRSLQARADLAKLRNAPDAVVLSQMKDELTHSSPSRQQIGGPHG
jgi:integrase